MRGLRDFFMALWVLSVLVFVFALLAATSNGIPAETLAGEVFRALSNPLSAYVNTFMALWAGVVNALCFIGIIITSSVLARREARRRWEREYAGRVLRIGTRHQH